MKFTPKNPARIFTIGQDKNITIKDCGEIELEPNELVTFKSPSGTEYDVVKKEWGYYATPSLNGRLKEFGLRSVLVKNQSAKFFVLLVEEGKEPLFEKYLEIEKQEIVLWLDNDDALNALVKRNKTPEKIG